MAKDPNEVTDAMRKAVYAADCLAKGHVLEFSNIVDSISGVSIVIGGTPDLDDTKLPYVQCSRCDSVWLLIPHAGADYDDAERYLYDKLNADSPMAKKIVRDRGDREKNPKKDKKLAPRLQES